MKHQFRFLTKKQGSYWQIVDEENRHLRKVLRLREGDEVEFFDGQGTVGKGLIINSSLHHTEVEEIQVCRFEQPLGFDLAIGALKPKSMDELLPSLIELGADHLHVFLQPGTAKHRISESAQNRWKRISTSASKQCKRAFLPKISCWKSLSEMLEHVSHEEPNRLYLDIGEHPSLVSTKGIQDEKTLAVIGGELGLLEEELKTLQSKGFKPHSLGPHVLRAFTAAIATASILAAQP